MASVIASKLPILPLVLWETPPGLEMILRQEGIAFTSIHDPHPLAFAAGRFVLYDGRRVPGWKVRGMLTAGHVPINIDVLRGGERVDPFQELIDTSASRMSWVVGGLEVSERVARYPKAPIRQRVLDRLREVIAKSGGIWARLAAFPYPYRSAFNLRVDLDEPFPDDYARFASARKPIDSCTTHFVSTNAYGTDLSVLDDLRQLDTQSHGHFHVVYRDGRANRRNLERAHAMLVRSGFSPVAFAAPEGRWNPGLDQAVEDLGYRYSSEFQLDFDDRPFFPWRGNRFSSVLQVPVHPICEGLLLERDPTSAGAIAEHLIATIARRISAGEPAFIYGHPERRLGRHPEIVSRIADFVASEGLLWRVSMTEFADWWLWRGVQRWELVDRDEGRFEIRCEDWDRHYPLALEIVRGEHVASMPLTRPRVSFAMSDLAYQRRRTRVDGPEPRPVRLPLGWKTLVRSALDWETITPLQELPEDTLSDRLKKRLRRWRSGKQVPQ